MIVKEFVIKEDKIQFKDTPKQRLIQKRLYIDDSGIMQIVVRFLHYHNKMYKWDRCRVFIK